MKRFVLFICVLCLLTGCKAQQEPVTEQIWAMDTYMDLQIWGKDADAAMEQIADMITELEKNWSVSEPASFVNAPENITPEAKNLMEILQALSQYTHGAFDPTLGAVSRAWGFPDKNYRVPTQEELTRAMETRQWDMGGCLKGYAGRQAVLILERGGVDCALLSLGGNIQTYGTKPDKSPWQIGIQNPDGGDPVGVLSVEGTMAVVTSGDYQRYFEENGTRYHHILDPETGSPANSGLRSVTVVCTDGLKADVLSTALFVMGMEEATAFWRQDQGFDAVFITTDGKLYATEGVLLSGCEYEVIAK